MTIVFRLWRIGLSEPIGRGQLQLRSVRIENRCLWRRALDHFDGIKIGLTATPSVMRDDQDGEHDDRVAIRDTLRFFEVGRRTYRYFGGGVRLTHERANSLHALR